MDRRRVSLLAVAAAVFLAFVAGFFLGRGGQSQVRVSVRPSAWTAPSETTEDTTPPQTTAPVEFPIDLNTATQRQLLALPGVGQVLADRILAYRQDNGTFTRVEDLLNVEGIGQKRLEAIWDLVYVNTP